MTDFIPVNEPLISQEAKENVLHALETGWISSAGPFVKQFEENYAAYLGVKHAISVTNGTAALHVAFLSLGIGPGDEVIVPAFTMAATWLAVLYTGARPVFVDCELDTYNIDHRLIESKISKRTKAIVPVHVYGHPVDMDPIITLAKKHHIKVVEDAAEAHGAEYKGKKCGSLGDINCFSFYGNKIISTGEGGMVVTNDDELARRARKFKDLCHSDKRFIHDGIGFNYRMTNLQAAIGCGELLHINEYIGIKQSMAQLYTQQLKDIPGVIVPVTKHWAKNVYWMYSIQISEKEFGMGRDNLRSKLKSCGIDTRDFFYPPSSQPVLHSYLKKGEKFTNSELIANRGLYLPSGLSLTLLQLSRVTSSILDFCPSLHKS
jgi:perosamine synthetase